MELEILRISKSTNDSVSLWFNKDPELPNYKPGQHGVFSFSIGDQVLIRTYSFHTSPAIDPEVGITVRAVEGATDTYLPVVVLCGKNPLQPVRSTMLFLSIDHQE